MISPRLYSIIGSARHLMEGEGGAKRRMKRISVSSSVLKTKGAFRVSSQNIEALIEVLLH